MVIADKLLTKHAVLNFTLLQKIYSFYQLTRSIYYIKSVGGFEVSMTELQNKSINLINIILV